ncbi:MAG: prepilin-type N-terminal cleavage/methylation domain-containing protein [Planctomycetia bacterium]|nr:prepilin-type N-terminal cleavage/methylation domain-containing protein [Planctomycetia bacterium]
MRRAAYTLIEVLLALAIAAILLGALYSALSLQIRGMNSGRELIEQSAIVRSLFNRMGIDITASINLVDPARFRNLAAAAEAAAGTTTTTASSSTGGTSTGGTSTGGTSTGGTSTGSSSSTTTDSTTTTDPTVPTGNVIPLGVMGDSTSLHLFASKLPTDALKGQLTCDIQRISYWIGQKGGLCRAEMKVVLSQDALNPTPPLDDNPNYNIAPEVVSAEFQYFDGSGWQDSWDSSLLGSDEVTPIGPPRAIAITLTVVPSVSGTSSTPQPKTYRHVVVIPTANGESMNPAGGS